MSNDDGKTLHGQLANDDSPENAESKRADQTSIESNKPALTKRGNRSVTRVTDHQDGSTPTVEFSEFPTPPMDNSFEVGAGEPGAGSNAPLTLESAAGSMLLQPGEESSTRMIGSRLGGYEILSELGRGGMGVVYKARDIDLERVVALKLLLSGTHASSESLTRFVTEIKSVASLQHPGIVQLFEVGENDGLPFYSMEFIDGQELEQKFRKKPASPTEAATIAMRMAEAMQYSHDHGVLHRDIKPSNVLVAKGGTIKIADFGLAKQVDVDDGQTRTGTILGTPGYMSPEQARGEAKELGFATDQYAIGAVLYRLIAGRAPFVSSKAMDTIMQVIECEPVPLQQLSSEVPVDLETICLKALSKEPQNRYANCEALANDLRCFLNGKPIKARPIGSAEKLTRWCRRNPKIAGLLATTFFLMASLAGVMTWSSMAVASQRDRALSAEEEAKDNLAIAVENGEKARQSELLALASEKKAIANEEIAREQALKIVKTMQDVLTEIDVPLSSDPKFAATRLDIMNSLSKTFDDLEIELHTDVKSQAMPTLMSIRYNLVKIFSSLNEGKLARNEIKRVYEMAKERVKIREGVDSARFNLAQVLLLYASVSEKADGLESTRPLLDEAIATTRDILENPKGEDYESGKSKVCKVKERLAAMIQNKAVIHMKSGEIRQAASLFKESADIQTSLLDSLDEDEEFKTEDENFQKAFARQLKLNGRRCAMGAATAMLKTGDTKAALAELKAVYDRAKTDFATSNSQQDETALGDVIYTYAYNSHLAGDLANAEKLYREAEVIRKKHADRNPDDYQSQRGYSINLYHLGNLLESLGNDQATSCYETCLKIRQKLAEKNPDIGNETLLMSVLSRMKQTDKALEIANRLNQKENVKGSFRVRIAKALVQCSRFADEPAQKDAIVSQGLAVLEKAIADGYTDWFAIKTDPDFEPVFENDQFKATVTKLKESATKD